MPEVAAPDAAPSREDIRNLVKAAIRGGDADSARLARVTASMMTDLEDARSARADLERTVTFLRMELAEYTAIKAAASPSGGVIRAACRHICITSRKDPDALVPFAGVPMPAWVRHAYAVRGAAEFMGFAAMLTAEDAETGRVDRDQDPEINEKRPS